MRIIAATNRDLEEEVEKGTFREDLFYRLNVMQIRIPPLRERREDIPVLARFYLEHFNRKFNKHLKDIDPAFLQEMEGYYWKGNVRELRNVLEFCAISPPPASSPSCPSPKTSGLVQLHSRLSHWPSVPGPLNGRRFSAY